MGKQSGCEDTQAYTGKGLYYTNRGFPLHVALDSRTKTRGVIICEQVKALDIVARNAMFFEKVPQDILDEVIDIVVSFVE